jgi:hypothetical protein
VELLDWFVMDRRWELWSLRQSFDR